MKINTHTRGQLKSYFVRNAIPTESNFADLIDGLLNQKDDGIVKQQDSPLSLEAAGSSDTSQKPALHFYRDFNNDTADWAFTLNPFSKSGDANTARLGFNIADGAGNSRLFIDQNTGNVGIGTVEPGEKLSVSNGDISITGGRYRRLKIVSDKYWAGIELVARNDGEAGRPHIDFTHGDLDAPNFGIRISAPTNTTLAIEGGNVGIGLINPAEQLHVNGPVRGNQGGALRISTGNGYVDIGPKNGDWSHFYTDRSRYYFDKEIRVDTGNIGSYNQNLSLQTAGTTQVTILNGSGNVGIGTTNPTGKLDINGDLRFNGNGNRRIVGDARAGRNTIVLDGHWDALEVKGRVLDWTGSNLHIGYDNDHSNDAIYIGNGKLAKVEIQGQTELAFGSTTRQMLNLWSTGYGIGVQSGTMYFRSDNHFAWFAGGQHSNATYDAGSGGKRLMTLNSAGDLILCARTNPTNDSKKSPCRALVDYNDKLILNFGGDFSSVETSKDFIVRGQAYKPGGGNWANTSDLALKKNVDQLRNSLNKLMQLRGVTFEWKQPENHNNLTGTQMGLIAQEVEQVFPEWVTQGPDGYKAISLNGFEALVIETFRELNANLEKLSTRLANVEQALRVEV